jgi:hypothetical protein
MALGCQAAATSTGLAAAHPREIGDPAAPCCGRAILNLAREETAVAFGGTVEESPEPADGSSRRAGAARPFTALLERHRLGLPVGPPSADRRDFRWVGLSIDVEVPRDKPPGRSAELPVHPLYRWHDARSCITLHRRTERLVTEAQDVGDRQNGRGA